MRELSTDATLQELVLPMWAQWIQALGPVAISLITAIVAVVVGVIAYRQWKTAREKLVLDLFKRRFTLYIAAKAGVDEVVRDGSSHNNNGIRNIAVVRGEGMFLFGDEVLAYFRKLQEAMARLGLAQTMVENGDESQDWPQVSYDALMFVSNFYEDFPRIAAPYMQMAQKLHS